MAPSWKEHLKACARQYQALKQQAKKKAETVPKRRITGKHNPLKPRRKGEDID